MSFIINKLADVPVVVPTPILDHSFTTRYTIASTIISTLSWIIGVASVIAIIVGALMYTISGGDATKTKRAKDAIVYAVAGLGIAMMGYGIVTFVIGRITK